jgi:hypothetical protein
LAASRWRAAGEGAGEPHPRSNPSELARLIGNALAERASPCSVITTPGVIPRIRSETNFRIPDLAVTCSAYGEEELIEILSPSNRAETWANVWAYTTVPSIKEILVLNSAKIGAELLRRAEDGSWPPGPQAIETGEPTLGSIGFSMPLGTTRLAKSNATE